MIQKKIEELLALPFTENKAVLCRNILNLIDLTTLEITDTEQKVKELCQKAVLYDTAAVCVYPSLAKVAKENLQGKKQEIACVAGGFPASQTSLAIKCEEVDYAIAQGATEIDMVMSLRLFFQGDFEGVKKEISEIKKCCGNEVKLKVILETGALQSPENIKLASELAIEAGADCIKTSTGKIAISATLEAFYTMLLVIKEVYEHRGKKIAIKAAGGISDADTAIKYYLLVSRVLGEKWLNKEYFRIGASRLADGLAGECGLAVGGESFLKTGY